MTVMEKDIEAKLTRMVKQHGGLCLKWVCPGWAGVPDRMVLLPGGRIKFVELKRPKGGRLSSRQKWWRKVLQSLGFEYCVIWNEVSLQIFQVLLQAEDGVEAEL